MEIKLEENLCMHNVWWCCSCICRYNKQMIQERNEKKNHNIITNAKIPKTRARSHASTRAVRVNNKLIDGRRLDNANAKDTLNI